MDPAACPLQNQPSEKPVFLPCRKCGKMLDENQHHVTVANAPKEETLMLPCCGTTTVKTHSTSVRHLACPHCGEPEPLQVFWNETKLGKTAYVIEAIFSLAYGVAVVRWDLARTGTRVAADNMAETPIIWGVVAFLAWMGMFLQISHRFRYGFRKPWMGIYLGALILGAVYALFYAMGWVGGA